jgi:hypothetical protein
MLLLENRYFFIFTVVVGAAISAEILLAARGSANPDHFGHGSLS